jgi:UPF0271 protein
LPEGVDGRALLDRLRALPNVTDAVVTERHALIAFDPGAPTEGIDSAVECTMSKGTLPVGSRAHTIPVRYDGEDLEEVGRTTGLARHEIVNRHTAGRYVVAAIGFLPGFAYLRGLDRELIVPRRSMPRSRVGALQVAIAGPYTGVYPFASPGGWNVVGTAIGFKPFDVGSGATLALGDRVRFVESAP